MIRALLGCVALVAMLAAGPRVARADSLPDPDRAQWDREDADSPRSQGWRKQAHLMLETHMQSWGFGGQIGPVLTGATLAAIGAGLEVASGSGYVLLYFALPLGIGSWAMSLGIWPTFLAAYEIVNTSASARFAAARFRHHQKLCAYTALGLGILATVLTPLAAVTAGVTAFLAGVAFAPIPFLGHASVAYGVFAKQLEARAKGGRYHRSFGDPTVSIGPGSLLVRF